MNHFRVFLSLLSFKELAFGIRGIFEVSSVFNIFIAGGFVNIDAEAKVTIENISASEDDDGNGYWYSVGFYITLAEHINLGAQARWSKAEITIGDYDGEAGGQHMLLLIDFHW